MTCSNCGRDMIVAGARVQDDKIVTNWLCTHCCHRSIAFTHNPRYQPILREPDPQRLPDDHYYNRKKNRPS